MQVSLFAFITSMSILASYSAQDLYCMPTNQTCWPKESEWNLLKEKLSGRLYPLQSTKYDECRAQGTNAFNISDTGNGICMQYHDCAKEFCNVNRDWNIPAYSVEAHEVKDVQAALEFANKYNIAVSIKTSGHSYSGSSTGKGTLMIWMHKFQKYNEIKTNFSNTCMTNFNATIKVGGGETWADVYHALQSKYHIVGGGGLTISAAGGWLQGVGLSALSRSHGTGIDNVINFEVVLANGTLAFADACTNTDLFWALRGGGGGTFGVVTSVTYRLWPVQNVVRATMYFYLADNKKMAALTEKWVDKWVELSLNLDRRWGGYWSLSTYLLYFLGNEQDAATTFANSVNEWKMSLNLEEQSAVYQELKTFPSYYESRGGINSTADDTGFPTFNIANRLIPRLWVQENPEKAKEVLKYLIYNGFFTFNYILGGAMEEIAINETAVNPAMRKALWQLVTFDERMIQKLRDTVPDTGVGYNHAAKNEPNWQAAFWGSNLDKLKLLKRKYDPGNRFNCWHCIGYQGPEIPSSSSHLKCSLFTVFSYLFGFFVVKNL